MIDLDFGFSSFLGEARIMGKVAKLVVRAYKAWDTWDPTETQVVIGTVIAGAIGLTGLVIYCHPNWLR